MEKVLKLLLLFFVMIRIAKCADPIVVNAEPFCQQCEEVFDGFLSYIRNNATDSMIKAALLKLCLMYASMNTVACEGLINIEFNTIMYITRNKPELTGKRICAVSLQYKGCIDETLPDWTINIEPKLDTIPNIINDTVTSNETLNILHLTDIHFDNLYTPGRNSKCDLPLCCQKDSGSPAKKEDMAGYWGDYNMCDIPWNTVQESLKHIKKQHPKIDMVYYTGDIISHIGWKTTKEGNTNDIKQLNKLFRDTFGQIPVYSVLGNHEAHPCDFYSSDNVVDLKNVSTQWVFDLADEEWSNWLPKTTSSTVRKGGFYTVLVKPNLRIIALNNNVCYIANLWLLYNDVDPNGQLQWLADTLSIAEKNGEFVHILAHVPPGNIECHKIWNREFVKIIKRYSHIIQAQFNGHTHEDEFRLFYDDTDPTKVINVAFNGASLTTFVSFNPNYKMVEINPQTWEVKDIHTWIFNLTEANMNPKKAPQFYKLYSFLEDYKLASLSKENLGQLVNNMNSNKALQYQYFRYKIRDSDFLLNKGCDKKCLNSITCFIRSVNFEDTIKC